ncbi:hypothetical protein LCGC14_1681900 [marine sediment metagenome]|uniref:Uncharacterized protein n=1 Tax=marine sediment metagenome TaxID=412755 RepID=A0A0F9KNC5_9ZZZZ
MSRTSRGGGLASPPYSFSHSGPVLVCGNAYNLHDDLERARQLYPDAAVIAINGAAGEVKACALYSKHPEKMPQWIKRQRQFGEDFTVHGSKHKPGCPWIDFWWEDARGGGGSAWGARKLATLMGFAPVILCGAPLDPGGYASSPIAKLMRREDVIDSFRQEIENDVEWHEGVYSMSGWTSELLGEPK